ncbi:MAG TPA: cytochrome C oxidase subunit IV family protein [Oscillatoriaceae cyanobacterium]
MRIVPLKVYFSVWIALMVLLTATVVSYFFNLGPFNVAVNLAIAVAKACLVIVIFMHVRYSHKLVWLYSVGAFYWLAIMFSLTFSDFLTRGYLPMPGK